MSMTDRIVGGSVVVLGGSCTNSVKPGYIATKPIAVMAGNGVQTETVVNSGSPSRPISTSIPLENHSNGKRNIQSSFIFASPTNQSKSSEVVFDKEQCDDAVSSLSSRFRRVCVFCGACSGSREIFQEAAVELGRQLVLRGIGLVYGGGSVGLMGMVSRVVSDGGEDVLGVIPRALMQEEITGRTIGKVVVVNSMHERKAEMARLSDAFIALPGGYGTLEELLEVITWSQLGIHKKPVGLLNVGGYYDSLLAFLDNAVGEGFIQPAARHIFVSADNAYDLMRVLEDYVACHDQVAAKLCWGDIDYTGEVSSTFI